MFLELLNWIDKYNTRKYLINNKFQWPKVVNHYYDQFSINLQNKTLLVIKIVTIINKKI